MKNTTKIPHFHGRVGFPRRPFFHFWPLGDGDVAHFS